jgi:hypothetical protein
MTITENVKRCQMKRIHGQCPLQEQGKINKQNNISENTWKHVETGITFY